MIHIAGPYDWQTYTQRCVRCAALVAVPSRYTVEVEVWNPARRGYDVGEAERVREGRRYPEGALVEVGPHGTCLVLDLAAAATCQPRAESEAA